MKTSMKRSMLSKDKLAEIARNAGFPNFFRELEGHGRYLMFTSKDGTHVATYDPKTGEQVTNYKPRQSIKFNNPVSVGLPDDDGNYTG
jgi:hypothetical protein